MCNEEYVGKQALGSVATMPSSPYNEAKDIDPRQRQAERQGLMQGPSIRMQLERRLRQSREQTTQVADALQLLTPEVEAVISAMRLLNRLGMLQL